MADLPPLNWPILNVSKRRTDNDYEASQPEEIVSKLRSVDVLVGQRIAYVVAIQHVSVTQQTYYRLRKQYGGMGTDQLKELKKLQKENEQLILETCYSRFLVRGDALD